MISDEEFMGRVTRAFRVGVTPQRISQRLDVHPSVVGEWAQVGNLPPVFARETIIHEIAELQKPRVVEIYSAP